MTDLGANSNPSATGSTGSTESSDPVTASYGNTHSSTNRANPIHPSDPQSTANPAYGNSTFSSQYETGGGNPGQGDGEGPGVGEGVGRRLESGGLGKEYYENVEKTYGDSTGRDPPEGWRAGAREGQGRAGPYDTAGGNAAQAGAGEGSAHMGASAPPIPNTADSARDTEYRAPPSTDGNSAAGSNTENKSTGSTVKDFAMGLLGKGHGVKEGESERGVGTEDASVDRAYNAVISPHPVPFPSLRPLEEYAEDGEGEFPAAVFGPVQKKPVSRLKGDDGAVG